MAQAFDHAFEYQLRLRVNYGDPLGERSLRQEIANHLAISRGVRCQAEQVVITDGAQAALNLCVQLFSNLVILAGWKSPGYQGARTAMRGGELRLHPMPVDASGLLACADDWQQHKPTLIYTTPSHQYPTGSVLSVQRRARFTPSQAASRRGLLKTTMTVSPRWFTWLPVKGWWKTTVLYIGLVKPCFGLRLGFLVLPERVMHQLHDDMATRCTAIHLWHCLGLCKVGNTVVI